MLRTRDGYRVTMPRFRIRRLRRRLATRGRDRLAGRAAARFIGTLVGRAMKLPRRLASFPVFGARIGTTNVELVTKVVGPRSVLLLYIRRAG